MAAEVVLAFTSGARAAERVEEGCPAPPTERNVIVSDEPIINGTARSDYICAGRSANVIIGGLLDDDIYGAPATT
jgi:hypothetical protein